MLGITTVVEEDTRWSVTGLSESSSSNLFLHSGNMRLLQESNFSVQRHSTDFEMLSRTLEQGNEKNSLSFSAKEVTGNCLEIKADRDRLLLRLIDYKASRKFWNASHQKKTVF